MIKERVMVVGVCVCGHVMQMLIGVKARSTVAVSLVCLFSHLSLTVRVHYFWSILLKINKCDTCKIRAHSAS